MSTDTNNSRVLLQQLALAVHEEFAQLVAALLDERSAAEARQSLLEHLESFELLVAEADSDTLLSRVQQLQSQLRDNAEPCALAEQLLLWIDQLVDDQNGAAQDGPTGFDDTDLGSAELCLDDLAEVESVAEFAPLDAELEQLFSEDDEPAEGADLLIFLARELELLRPQLAAAAERLAAGVEAESLALYRQLLERVRTTAVELELGGLVFVVELVVANLEAAADEQWADLSPLLAGWSEVMVAHLLEPASDERCLAVADYLELDGWVRPLAYAQQRELLEGLARSAEISGEVEAVSRKRHVGERDLLVDIDAEVAASLSQAFIGEAPQQAQALGQAIADLAKGEGLGESLRLAQRLSHTLKGSAHLVGVTAIANLAHHLEDLFEFLARANSGPSTSLLESMAEAADGIEAVLDYVGGSAPAPVDLKQLLQQLIDWALLADAGELDALTQGEASAPAVQRADEVVEQAQEVAADETLRISRRALDRIFNLVGETSIALGQMQEQLKHLRAHGQQMRQQDQRLLAGRFELENLVNVRGLTQRHNVDQRAGDFDSLEMDYYDDFYGASHSFIETVEDSREAMRQLYSGVQLLEGIGHQQQRLNSELQDLVMSTRLEPVGSLSSRLQRCVRQACRMTGKRATLEIHGADLLMDGDTLKQLADPLMHMLRNAVDHGIEEGERRLAAGKPEEGLIELVFRKRGNRIEIELCDDGAGLDFDTIRRKAIDNGLLDESEVADEAQLARLLTTAGFSTRDRVTQVSGRGVGMDVVHSAVLELKGSLQLANRADRQGTRVHLELPITLLAEHYLLVEVDSRRYAVASVELERVVAAGSGRYCRVGERAGFEFEGEVYPLECLGHLLGLGGQLEACDLASKSILLARSEAGLTALAVDQLLACEELVIKSLGPCVTQLDSVSGMSMLGDGSLVPVLNLAFYLRADRTGPRISRQPVNTGSASAHSAKVLIVDDSLSVRTSLAQLMSDSGYQPVLARDGVEALALAEQERPDLVLTDLEMPRMNGLELTAHLRAGRAACPADIPVIMVTSRTQLKHRGEAQNVGVSRYLNKPFSEDDLVAAIAELRLASSAQLLSEEL